MHDDELNPAQQELLEALGAGPDERPRFDPGLRPALRRQLDRGLDEACADFEGDDRLFVNKHDLAGIMGCERRFVAEAGTPFEWSVPLARGTIAHKAIELSIHFAGEPTPLQLVAEAVDSLAHSDRSIAQWLQTASERELAELRSQANDRVARFVECWPPLKPAWMPVTEARLRYEHAGAIVLSGKVDLSLGRPRGDQAGKVLVDLKTGARRPEHLDDLRFYGLLETLVVGTPPRLLATYYLDQGRLLAEDVTEGLLELTVARISDGVARIIETGKRLGEPSTAPGPPCRWCVVQADCPPGLRYLADDDNDAGLPGDDEDDEADDPADGHG